MHLTGYNIVRRGTDSSGGGLVVYIDEHLQFNHINKEVRPNIKAIWFEFIPTKSEKIFFRSLYRKPNFGASVFSQEVKSIFSELFEGRK